MTSEEPLPERCGAQCRDGGYCTQYPVEGAARCRMHGGTADNAGENNGNYEHGGFSESIRSHYSDDEEASHDDLVDALRDPDRVKSVGFELAAEAWHRYKRSNDPRFLREFRQLCDQFSITPEEVQKHEVEHSGEVGGEYSVSITHHRVTEDDVG